MNEQTPEPANESSSSRKDSMSRAQFVRRSLGAVFGVSMLGGKLVDRAGAALSEQAATPSSASREASELRQAINSYQNLDNFIKHIRNSDQPQEFLGAVALDPKLGHITCFVEPPKKQGFEEAAQKYIDGPVVLINPIFTEYEGVPLIYTYNYASETQFGQPAIVDTSGLEAYIKASLHSNKLSPPSFSDEEALFYRVAIFSPQQLVESGAAMHFYGSGGAQPKMSRTYSPDGKNLYQKDDLSGTPAAPVAQLITSTEGVFPGGVSKSDYTKLLEQWDYKELPGYSYKF